MIVLILHNYKFMYSRNLNHQTFWWYSRRRNLKKKIFYYISFQRYLPPNVSDSRHQESLYNYPQKHYSNSRPPREFRCHFGISQTQSVPWVYRRKQKQYVVIHISLINPMLNNIPKCLHAECPGRVLPLVSYTRGSVQV